MTRILYAMCLLALALADSWEDTLDHYQAKLRGDPQNQFANSIVGILSFRLNKISEAAAPLHRAVQLDENDWVAAQHLGLCYSFMAKRQAANLDVVKDQTAYTQSLEETVKWLTHSLSIMNQETADNNPQKVSLKQPATIIYRVLGDSLLWLFREPEAREFYQKAVSLGLWEDAWCRPVRPAATIHKSVGIFPNNILQEIIGPFEAAMPRIHKEFNQFIISKKTQGAPLKLEPEAAGLSHFKKWNYLLISNNGQVQPAVCESFPALCEVISSLPETRLKNGQIKFSILAAGAHIKPHSGPTNRRLRMHCGMTVPPSTEIRIRTETRTWEKNKCFVFDESCEHEVWNNSTDPRVVLIVDFVNPLLEDRSDFLQEVQPPYTKKPHRETLIKNFNAIQARWLASEECPIKT